MKDQETKEKHTAQSVANVLESATPSTQNEKDVVGYFVLKLHHDQYIHPGGFVLKETVRRQFREYLKANGCNEDFTKKNIGRLICASNFLTNTPKKSDLFQISIPRIIQFRCQKLKLFEADYAGSFLLTLLHREKIEKDGLLLKTIVRSTFQEYLKSFPQKYEIYFRDVDIGSLLWSNNFLCNTPRGSEMYCIIMKRLFDYRNEKLKQLDELRVKHQSNQEELLLAGTVNNMDNADISLEETVEVSPDAKEFPVVFQGSCVQAVVPDFALTSLSCYICQSKYETQSDFEDHINTHGFESDFAFLTTTSNKKKSFDMNYRLCNKAHYFNFTMKTSKKDIIIEKIIIVQTRLMHFVKNNKVPYEMSTDGIDSFLVDSHLFTPGVEQPIVVVYRHKFDKTTRFVEQHNFLRTDDFPQVRFPTRSCRIPYHKIMKNKLKLDNYVPDVMIKSAKTDGFSDASLCSISPKMREYLLGDRVLSAENTCDVLSPLVQIEDLDIIQDYKDLYQKKAEIKRYGREYSVKFRKLPKGVLLENIVTPMDQIILTPSKQQSEEKLSNKRNKIKKYFALVERVNYNQVCFQYMNSFINEHEKYDIVLLPSRVTIRYQYLAMKMLSENLEMRNYLFPTGSNIQNDETSLDLKLFNQAIENNFEQLQAVRNIANGPISSAPFVLFGPPGTGKTSTIVETVLQLWQRRPNTRILITAASNAACDEVAVRLCQVLADLQPGKKNILRVFAKSNEKRVDCIDDILLESSNLYGTHFYPHVDVIREFRIVVCTLSVVGKLVLGGFGQQFFTHVFIDECAASTEPEALVGWMGISSSKTRLIVSGDPKQLGPVLKSKRAGELGLNLSLMERLLKHKCYALNETGDYNPSVQSRLVENFRSHPKIVELYNKLYYNKELKAKANQDDTNWALNWHLLPNKNHPIIFHSIYGDSRKSSGSVSLCNEQEINAVMEYVKDLMYFGIKGRTIKETDIGIISPYKKQCKRIQEELNLRQWHKIDVGAVETFQGKEKPIIIVSTVRSFTKTLGFLDNPRRLNVMLSRAKALLIIIGNPRTLGKNKDYKYLIDECRRNKCTVGGFRGYDEEEDDESSDKNENQLETPLPKRSLSEMFGDLKLNSSAKPQKARQTTRASIDVKVNSNMVHPKKDNASNFVKQQKTAPTGRLDSTNLNFNTLYPKQDNASNLVESQILRLTTRTTNLNVNPKQGNASNLVASPQQAIHNPCDDIKLATQSTVRIEKENNQRDCVGFDRFQRENSRIEAEERFLRHKPIFFTFFKEE